MKLTDLDFQNLLAQFLSLCRSVASWVEAEIVKPSPFASLVCSLTIILSITSISLILKWCYNKWRAGRPINDQGRGDYVLGRLKEIDRTAVRWGSYLVGTHYRTPWRRLLGVLTFFATTIFG